MARSTVTKHFVGLDLGKMSDYSALAAVERTDVTIYDTKDCDPTSIHNREIVSQDTVFACRYLKRWNVGTSYPQVVKDVLGLLIHKPLIGCQFVVDETGVGKAVVDQFREDVVLKPDDLVAWGYSPSEWKNIPGIRQIAGDRWETSLAMIRSVSINKMGPATTMRPVNITAGKGWRREGMGFYVSKKELVSTMQKVLSSRKLSIAKSMEHAQVLNKELATFQVKITEAANETFEAWREREHDDLVLALAIALFVANLPIRQAWIR